MQQRLDISVKACLCRPVTNETFKARSLAETGFSILSALRMNASRFVVLYIDLTVDKGVSRQNL